MLSLYDSPGMSLTELWETKKDVFSCTQNALQLAKSRAERAGWIETGTPVKTTRNTGPGRERKPLYLTDAGTSELKRYLGAFGTSL